MISQKELGLVYASVNKDLTFDDLMLPNELTSKHDKPKVAPYSKVSLPYQTSNTNSPINSPTVRKALLPTPSSVETVDVKPALYNKGLFSISSSSMQDIYKRQRSRSNNGIACDKPPVKQETKECSSLSAPLRFPEVNRHNKESQTSQQEMATESEGSIGSADKSDQDSDVVICGKCYKSFSSVQNLQQHRAQEGPCLKMRTCKKCEGVDANRELKCPYCREIRETPWALIKHAQLKHRIIVCQEIEDQRERLIAARRASRCAGAKSNKGEKVNSDSVSTSSQGSAVNSMKSSRSMRSVTSNHSNSLLIDAKVRQGKTNLKSSQPSTQTKLLLSDKWKATPPASASAPTLKVTTGERAKGTPESIAVESHVCYHLTAKSDQMVSSDEDQLSVESDEESEPTAALPLKVSAKLVSSILGASSASECLPSRNCLMSLDSD